MWPMPAAALGLLGRSHGVEARLWASVNGSAFVLPVPIVEGSGSVTVDGGSNARRSLSVEVHADVDDPRLDPFTAELRAEYGLVEPTSGRTHWVPVGTFIPTEVQETGPGTVSVKAPDRWRRVVDARLERAITTSGDTLAAIVTLLDDADARLNPDTTRAPTGGTHGSSLWERDRTEPILKLARSIGAEVFMDAEGTPVVRRRPTLGDPAVWEVAGGTGGVKVGARRGKSSDRTYNAIVVTGEPDGLPPVYAVARDERPGSPTRWGAPMKRPRFYKTPLIRTVSQAADVAWGALDRYLSVARTLELEVLPHPGLDAGDVIVAEVRPGVWERHMVEGFTLPLGVASGAVTIATRAATGEDTDDGTE